jgi:hypothetical protein
MTRASLDDARRMLALLARPGDVFELRGLSRGPHGQQHIESGFFDNIEALARAACDRSGRDTGVYVTLNPTLPELLARAPKNKTRRAGGSDCASDKTIAWRRSLLVDIDPVRVTGISSTDAEHASAIDLAGKIRDALSSLGWPAPIFADSGNGAHLIYSVDLPVDDGGVVKRVLAKLSQLYTSPTLKVDEKVFNASRISKVYGTLTRKGENTPERPHRLARIIDAPEQLEVVSRELLEAFAPGDAKPATTSKPVNGNGHRPEFDLDTWIATHLPDARERDWESGRRWILPVCPFNEQHDRGEAYVTQKHDGSIAAGCQHESCFKTWKELRAHFEPGVYERREQNGRRLTDREPPPEVLYEDQDYRAEIDEVEAFAQRDREPAAAPPTAQEDTPPPHPPWWTAPELVEEVWKRKDDPWVSLNLGADELCRIRAGGIVVVMGGSGSGKSSLVANLVVDHARNAGPAIVQSIELPADELAARIVGFRCEATWEQALRGQVKREFMEQALALPRLYVIEREHATIANLRACARAVAKAHPGESILVAIDYAQLVVSSEREARAKVTDAFAQIDKAARDERFVAIAISQMSRASANLAVAGEKLGAETASLGAESAAIERFASLTLTIGKKGEQRQDGSHHVELSIGKARMSDQGDRVMPMSFFGRTGLWRCAGDAKLAADVRTERDVEKAARTALEIEDMLVGTAERSPAPLSREQLQSQISKGNKKTRRAAIEQLVACGRLVEVARRTRGSGGWPVWTEARALAAGAPLVRDLPDMGA